MTHTEKLSLLFNEAETQWEGHFFGIPRLGIPDMNINDGPTGFRWDPKNDTAT